MIQLRERVARLGAVVEIDVARLRLGLDRRDGPDEESRVALVVELAADPLPEAHDLAVTPNQRGVPAPTLSRRLAAGLVAIGTLTLTRGLDCPVGVRTPNAGGLMRKRRFCFLFMRPMEQNWTCAYMPSVNHENGAALKFLKRKNQWNGLRGSCATSSFSDRYG